LLKNGFPSRRKLTFNHKNPGDIENLRGFGLSAARTLGLSVFGFDLDVQAMSGLPLRCLPAADLPPELSGTSGSRNVVCLDGDLSLPDLPQSPINANGSCPSGQQLKRVRITINWTAQSGHSVSYTSADYLISQAGLCGAG